MRVNRNLGQAGDTIIEVLIAIAIVSSVLGIAYATMNRGLKQARDIQERTEALKLLQGQVESLRFLDESGVTLPANTFCIDGSPPNPVTGFTGTTPPTAATVDVDDFNGYPDQCVQEDFYHLAIYRDGADPRLYHFSAHWDQVGGGARDQINLVYRSL